MKLATLCRYFPKDAIGGGEIYIYEVWKRSLKNFDNRLVTGWKKDRSLLPEDSYKIDLSSDSSLLNYWKFYSKSKQYLKEIKPDLVHATCYEFSPGKIPEVITVCHLGHLFGRVGDSLALKFKKQFTSRRLNRADAVIAISKSTWNDLVKLGISEEKLSLAYPGINTELFVPKKTDNEKFTIIYPSRISREKAQHVAICAISRLPNDVLNNIRLQLVGFVNDYNYLEELKHLAKGLPVEIITNVQKIEDYVNDSEIVIFPTMMWEGFGIVAGEALAAGKPLIATGYPAVREVMGRHGIAIEPGDAKGLSDNIELLYNSSSERKKLVSGSREWILGNFNWDNTYIAHKKVFDEVLKVRH